MPCIEVKKLLDATGVPHGAGIPDSDVRSKGAWAAEKLRSSEEILALPDGIQARLLDSFDIPAAWRPEARRASLLTLLRTCRDSAWAPDPGLSCGLVNRQRSELFCFAERLSATKQVATTTPDHVRPRVSRLSFVPHSLQPATRTVTSRTSKGSGDSDRPQPTVTRQPADPQVVIRLHLHGRSRRSSVLSGWLLIHCSHPRNPRTKLRRPSRWRALSSLGLNQGMTRPSAWIPL